MTRERHADEIRKTATGVADWNPPRRRPMFRPWTIYPKPHKRKTRPPSSISSSAFVSIAMSRMYECANF
jgi:hypothetical protein